jgi:phytoene dehydrogenase-like protein
MLSTDVYRETFRELGTNLDEHVELLPVQPMYRCFFQEDNTQLDITADIALMRSQVEGVEAGGYSNLQRYLSCSKAFLQFGFNAFVKEDLRSSIPYALEFAKACTVAWPLGSHSRMLDRTFTSNKLKAAFSFQDLYVGLSPSTAPAVFALVSEHSACFVIIHEHVLVANFLT